MTNFKWFDPNPNAVEMNPPKTGDCVVRAFCGALGISWTACYDELCAIGRAKYDMPNARQCFVEMLNRHGFLNHKELVKHNAGCHGIKRYTVEELAAMTADGQPLHDNALFIQLANHCVCAKDGNFLDAYNCGKKCAYKVWSLKII